MHHRLGFDGKGSNVGISEEGATQNTGFAEARKQGEVARTGLQDHHGRPLKPLTPSHQRLAARWNGASAL